MKKNGQNETILENVKKTNRKKKEKEINKQNKERGKQEIILGTRMKKRLIKKEKNKKIVNKGICIK